MVAGFLRIACIALLLGDATLAQQPAQAPAGQQLATMPTSAPATDPQAVARTGLLPIYGVELGMDKTWADGDRFPSQSKNYPNSGVNASFQQVWDTLKPGGFNFLLVGFDVYDLPASANRAANVCNWAQHSNVKLLLVLRGANNGGTSDYASSAAAFVKTLAGALRQDAYKASYAQIAAYELEPDLNNPSVLKQVSVQAKAQELLLQTAQKVRTAETEALQGSGIDATPLIVRASFDYELVSARAIAGTTLANDAYNKAYSSLIQWLKPLAASPNIDLISVDWFPGTISAGGVDKPPALLRSLAADIPGKQMLFTTGFSTAFHSTDEQKQYYMMTFANLGDLRASSGASSPFLGVVFREALNAKNPAPPNSGVRQAMSKWDWQSKADELAAMWSDNKKSEDMNWWAETVQHNMGLLDAQADALTPATLKAKPALQALAQINSAVSSASASSGTGAAAAPGAVGTGKAPGQGSGFGQILQAKAEQGLSGLLDSVMGKLGNMIQSGGGGGGAGFVGGGSGFAQGMGATPVSPCLAAPISPVPGAPSSSAASSNLPPMSSTAVPCTPDFGSNSLPAPSGSGALGGAPSVPANTSQPGPIALPPGSITLTKQDISFKPPSPRVGQPVQIVAKLHNQNASDAVGITILASGAKNAVLAQADSLRLPPSSVYPATLQWSPKDATPTSIVIKVSDGTGAEIASVSLDPITVAPAADPAGTGKTPAPSGPASASGGAAAGPGAASSDSSSTALAPLGFAKIGDLVLPQNLVAGAAASILVPISNPLLVPLNNIKAVLMVDGKAVQTQTISTLIPQQSRSIVFSNVVIAQPGSHEAKVGVQLQRGDAKPQMGAVTQNIFVQSPGAVTTAAGKKPAGGVPPGKIGQGGASTSAQLRSLVPTTATAGSKTTTANAAPTGGSASGSAHPGTAAGRGALTLSASDLSYSPMPAKPGQPVAFRVVVRNMGDAAVQGAALVLSLYADGKLIAASQPPIQFSVAAKSSYQANWRAPMPVGRQIELVAAATANGNETPASGKASIMLKSAASVATVPARKKP